MSRPAWRLRIDVSGRAVPAGYTVTNPVPVGPAAVIVTAAAVIPLAMPSRPAIWTRIVAGSTGVHPHTASRVSARRNGPTGANRDGAPTTVGAVLAAT